MTTKGSGLDKGKKEVFRTRQKLTEKFGKAQKTVDLEFDQLWTRCTEHFEMLDKVKKYVDAWLVALTKMTVAETKLSNDITQAFDPRRDKMYAAAEHNKETIACLDDARAEMDQLVKEEFLENIAIYLRQAGVLKQRKQERDRRLVDMDRYRHDYQRHAEKGDHGKSAANKKKYAAMKPAYEAINAELLRDIPLFINDKGAFFGPLFARFYQAQLTFFARARELYGELLPRFGHIDRNSVHEHAHLITDAETSVMNEPIDLTRMPDRDALRAEKRAYRNSSSMGQVGGGQAAAPAQRARPPAPPGRGGAAAPKARALYDFQGQDNTELSFKEGDVITLTECTPGADWWEGELNGHKALLPASYVSKL